MVPSDEEVEGPEEDGDDEDDGTVPTTTVEEDDATAVTDNRVLERGNEISAFPLHSSC